jgi:CBS domain containing-hemolysin-like protein
MSAPDGSLDLFGIAWRLGATLFFVLLNGFFVAAEFALVKVRRSRIAELAEEGGLTARTTDHILRHLDHYLSACQLGITIASLVLGALGEPVVSRLIVGAAGSLGWVISPEDPLLHWVALVIAFSLITLLHMTIGEQAPKMAALQHAEKTSLASAIPLRVFAAVFRPFIALVNGTSNAMLRSAGLKPEHGFESSHTAEEIRHILSHSAQAGHITERQWELTENVFGLMDLEARHILVPRVDVVYLTLEKDFEENLRRMQTSGHSRFPLCEVGLDTVVGFVHIKDVFSAGTEAKPDMRPLARPAVFVPETQPLSELIVELQRQRSHTAVVLDEHGTATGLVFLEDALEEIVGPLADEFDRGAAERVIQELAPGSFEMPGNVPLPAATEALQLELEEAPEDTIGGHVVAQLGRMPRRGDQLELGNYRVSVVEVGRRRITRLRFERMPVPPNETGSEE